MSRKEEKKQIEKQIVSVELPTQLYEDIKQYAQEECTTASTIIRKAILMFMREKKENI